MKIYFVSLGCDKNTVDTQMMLGILSDAGHEITMDEKEAEVVVVNSCAFIQDAKQESIDTILEMAELKKTAKLQYLIVTGCLGQRYKEELTELIPEVDAILGIRAFDKLADIIADLQQNKKYNIIPEECGKPVFGYRRVLTGVSHYAYMKIAEGCDKHCTYCIIPKIRGTFASIPMEVLIKEATDLASRGVKELILIAQETTIYGTDLYGHKALPELINKLSEVEGIETIRLMYCYPEEINDELIAVIRDNPKVCHYLDIPIQSGADRVLKIMGRRTDEASLRNMINKLRKEIPDITLRTTLISGFPGEKRADHKTTCQFVKDMRFDRLGVFTYSAEEGTPAATMKGQVPEFVKRHRRDEIMKLQQTIAFEKARECIGRVLDVRIEGELPEEGVYVGRTYRDAPGIDGYVFIEKTRSLISGDRIKAKITGAVDYDLTGALAAED